jgi:dipeptidyl-peptidase-4
MRRLTVERVFSDPPLSGAIPGSLSIPGKGSWILFLANPPDARQRMDLYGYEVAAQTVVRLIDSTSLGAEGALTDAEKSARERRRQFSMGITSFACAPAGSRIALLAGGMIYVHDLDSRETRQITSPDTRQTDLRFSATGRYLSYVRAGDLYCFDFTTGRERRLTDDGSALVSSGVADFIAQEEMHRFDGHWWSPDDDEVVFTRVDEEPVPVARRYEFHAGSMTVQEQRYPYAGGPNARTELRIANLTSGVSRSVPWADTPDDYLARVTVTASAIVVQVQSRDQHRLTLKRFARSDLAASVLLEESATTWINLHDNLRFLPGSEDFLWSSERSGNSRLYRYRGADCEELTQLGRITRLVHANDNEAYFLGWQNDPTVQHCYRVRFNAPGDVQQLTQDAGWHDVVVEPAGRWFVDRYASVRRPPAIARVSLDTPRDPEWILANDVSGDHPYAPYLDSHAIPRFGALTAADGQRLHYRLTLPPDFNERGRYPAIIHVYGGPGVQRVVNDWPALTLQLLAQAGFAVFELDNRGSGNRDTGFEAPIYRRLGQIEVADQLLGLDHLQQQPWLDPERVAVFGHSYGGYLTLMCLAAAGARFRAGISVAPVTDWRLYDTHYTERYLSTPTDNPAGYDDSAVIPHVNGIRSRLLLMHGMADDNVLFDNTSLLMRVLQQHRVAFELMLYPGAKHALQEREVAIHRFDTILDFLRRHLS